MSGHMPTPPTKASRSLTRVALHAVGPAERLAAACAALEPLGFVLVPAPPADVAPVTLEMLPDEALVEARAVVPPGTPGQRLAGARSKEGLTQRQLAAQSGIPQRHLSEMERGKRPIGKGRARVLGKALHTDYRLFL
jgi:hypothetical protein